MEIEGIELDTEIEEIKPQELTESEKEFAKKCAEVEMNFEDSLTNLFLEKTEEK